jgi:hypothetical protein
MSDRLASLRTTLHGLDDKALLQRLREIEVLSRMTQSVMLDVVAEIDSRMIAGREGFGVTARLLSNALALSMAEARMRTEHAALVSTRRTLTGEALPPRLPATAAALAAGEIGGGQLRVITETMTLLPTTIPEPTRERIEADLVGYARDFDPRRLRIIARRVLDVVDPDGPKPADEPAPVVPARGELWLRDRRDGSLGLEGWLDPEHGSELRALIEQLATRRPTTDEGVPDDRSAPQRQADALIELCQRARASGELPHHRRRTSTRHDHHRLGHPAHRPRGRDPGLRATHQRHHRPAHLLRRQSHPGRHGWRLRAPRRGPCSAHCAAKHPPRTHREGPRMCVSWV